MPQGPLRTFFRQEEGMPDEEPDLTDFLLDSMIKKAPAMRGQLPTSTSPSRMSGMRPPAMGGTQDVQVQAQAYPAMPGAPPGPRPMPQMPQQGWADVLAQLLGGAGDVVSARAGNRTGYLQQVMGTQQGMRNQAFQQALAQRAAMEQASKLAHEYEWRRYGAGQQEAKQDFYEQNKNREADLYDKMLGKQKEKDDRFRQLLAATLPMEMSKAEDVDELKLMAAKALRETQGDPDLMAEVQRAQQMQLGEIIKRQKPGDMQKFLESKTKGFYGLEDWWNRPAPAAPNHVPYQQGYGPWIPNWQR